MSSSDTRLPPSEFLSEFVRSLVCLPSHLKKRLLDSLDEFSMVADLGAEWGIQLLPNNVVYPPSVASYPIKPIRKVIVSALSEPTDRERSWRYKRLVGALKLRKE